MIASVLVTFVLALALLRLVLRRAVALGIGAATGVPPMLAGSGVWARTGGLRDRFAQRFPRLAIFIRHRFASKDPAGLPLTLLALAALYLLALFSGLTEDILESQGTIHIDNLVNAALTPLRVAPLITAFHFVTGLGSGPSVIAAAIVATGFLWTGGRLRSSLALWVCCLGAMTTTAIGKLLVARHRPEFVLDVVASGWSFPSGHTTAATAAYGFIAYAVARALPGFRERFEIGYWSCVLIVLVGFSRIFLGVHYLTDVLGGFMVGGFWLLIGVVIAECRTPGRSRPTPDAGE